jgi:acetate kinase
MILVLNAGSSSIKYRLFDPATWQVLAGGLIERIGEPGGDGVAPPDHRAALETLVAHLYQAGHLSSARQLTGIGHRVVHGGEAFQAAVRVDEAVIAAIRAAIPLAPLHNPPNLLGIELCRELWPEVQQVAVFDTAFHHTLPVAAYRYGLPTWCYSERGIRRYGFHGTSFAYVTREAAAALSIPQCNLNAIILHLGNGASMAAIRQGRSIDTTMGMTPTAGLMMGTRCGDLDPGVVLYLLNQGKTVDEIDHLLNRESGFKGLTGSNDMRDVLNLAAAGDAAANLALDIYVYRIRFYLGAYLLLVGRLDALVFTGGIGEHAALVRERICTDLEPHGLRLDFERNQRPEAGVCRLEMTQSDKAILIVPTDEEREIAGQTARVLHAGGLPSKSKPV